MLAERKYEMENDNTGKGINMHTNDSSIISGH